MASTTPKRLSSLALHLCADAATSGLRRLWPPAMAARDTTERAVQICERLGVAEQWTLAGEQATAEALLDALRTAASALAGDGLVVLTFSGHTERGDGPVESARWCLVGGGVTLSLLASQLAQLPAAARLILLCDTCYASAIAQTLVGPQLAIVIASCGDDQTMVDRPSSEFMVRLERSVCATGSLAPINELRDLLEADTPDCERPVVWSNASQHAPPLIAANRGAARASLGASAMRSS